MPTSVDARSFDRLDERHTGLAHGRRTRLTPVGRFANHKAGTKAASVLNRYSVRLVPALYAHLNPMPYEAAAQMEEDLAEDLRQAGYTVTGGHQPGEVKNKPMISQVSAELGARSFI